MPVADTNNVISLTIASGASLSDVADMAGRRLSGVIMPAAWTAADLTVLVSDDGVTFFPLHDDDKTEAKITAPAVSEAYAFDRLAGVIAPWRYLKLRSGTKAAAVNQGAARVIKLVVES